VTGRFDFADRIRAVVFDVGNTLLWLDHARIAEICAANGLPCDETAARAAEMRSRPQLDRYLVGVARRHGDEVVRRYVDLLFENLGASGCSAARDAVLAAWGTLWVRQPADARPTLDALRARGYRLAAVSNSDGVAASLLAAAGLADAFECIVDSAIVGVEKPDPRIFAIAAQRIGVAADACVYVGDFDSIDVAGPRAAGMHAVLIDPADVWTGVDAPRIASLSELLARLL
jgi:HAD superfamily hydrolase (TIGR01509 family)